MEVKDLMIGDFILHNWGEKRSCKVTCVLCEEISVYFGEDVMDLNEGEFEPIPITDEILKNNEFIEINDNGDKWYKKQLSDKYDFVGLEKSECNYWAFACTIFPNLINHIFIKYVHELQHALRLVGLSEIADNLKV